MAKNDKTHREYDSMTQSATQGTTLQEEAPGADVTDEQLREDATNPETWLQYNKGLEQQGYSPADRITHDNVDQLEEEYSLETNGSQQTPIVVPSGEGEPPVMYYPEGEAVTAANARTGEEYWTFEYEPEYGSGNRNRGVSVWGDKVYYCGPDLRVVAIDRYTGEEQWTTHAVSERQLEEMEPSTRRLTNTAAPLLFDGVVLKGQSGEGGNWSAIVAMDAESGEKLWDYNVIPTEYWVGETWRFGDGAPWTTPAVDPDSGTAIFPTGNPSPQINGAVRPGPNKHTDSLIALDAETGEEQWTHQFLANDWWDYDTYLSHVFDMEVDGESRRVVGAKDKTGWTYVVDIETGQLLRRSLPHANQGAELPFMAIPPADEENAKEKSPTAIGATDWHPDGYSPETGLYYVCSIDDFRNSWYNPDWEFRPNSLEHDIGGGKGFIADPESGEKASRVSAIDQNTGEIVWEQPYDNSEFPFWAGGNTPTAGGLVFGGNNGGQFRALDAESGEVVWETDFGESISVGPVVWDDPEEGKQCVAVSSANGITAYAVEGEQQTENTEESTEADGETNTDGETDTDGETATDADPDGETDSEVDVDGEETTATDSPGFGAAAGAAGVAGGAYAAKKRFESDDELNDETGDEHENDGGETDHETDDRNGDEYENDDEHENDDEPDDA